MTAIVSFLMEHGLLSNIQFGFMKGRSTTLQLLNIMNDERKILPTVYIWSIKKLLIKCYMVDY